MSEFLEVKTADLVGAALDWAVAKAEGVEPAYRHVVVDGRPISNYRPSTNWSQGGPLISKYHMDFCCEHPETIGAALCDENGMYIDDRMMFGKTHLIAACRAIVASVLGETVSVPKELLS
ncbi:phage protein NinX family protein [Pseudomonas syringae]|uniref:phage protein NinX family protein n=1 Tax=Pseudomonas syringae TaxID=317 RepID=UPI000E30EB40|nr:phage protein NinX family protein [Pseudomonas syringae]